MNRITSAVGDDPWGKRVILFPIKLGNEEIDAVRSSPHPTLADLECNGFSRYNMSRIM